MDRAARHLLNALAAVRQHIELERILTADLEATVAAVEVAVLKDDQAAVEEIRTKIHNIIDELIDHRWSGRKLADELKNISDR